MGEAVLLLLHLLLVVPSVQVQAQAQAQEELSTEDILCIRHSRQETALGRWLECMQPQEFQDPQTELLSSNEKGAQEQSPTMDKENLQIEPLTMNEGDQAENELPAGEGLFDTGGEDRTSAPVHMYSEDGEEANSTHFSTVEMRATKEDAEEQRTTPKENPQPEQLVANKGEFLEEDKLPAGVIQVMGRGHVDSAPVRMHNKDGEEASSTHLQTVEMRVVEEDALLGWLKLNLGLLALGKLLCGLAKKCSRKKAGKKSSEFSIMYITEDSIEAAPEVSKAVIVDDTPARKYSETAYFPMLGSSLGSAVGAVVAEVVLKTCSSGSSVSTDKISMLLESALEELSTPVQGDDGRSRLVGDFISSFKSTYATMYRIHHARTSYGGSRETNSHLQRDNSFSILKPTCEDQCTSGKSKGEMIHSPGTDPLDDTSQVKQALPLLSSNDNINQVKLESRPRITVDSLSEKHERSTLLVDRGETDSAVLATSTVENHDSGAPIEFKHVQKLDACYERREIPSFVGNNDEFEDTSFNTRGKFKDKGASELGYEVDDASSVCEEHPSLMQSNTVGRLDALALMGQAYGTVGSEFQKDFLKLLEQHNQIKFAELKHRMKQQILEEEKIQLKYEANGLMRENIDLSRSKASFRETRILEKQAKAAYMSFSTTCADELAAGMFVMLISLAYSVRKYSFALLNDLVSTCQPAVNKEPRRSLGFHIDWFYNSLDLLAGKLQAFVCHITLTGRILIGSLLVVTVAWSLLRRSVTNSSQAMPATILIIVLGGVCGFVGKVAVDSLGGCGNRWWVVWGGFCLMHALTNCLTPSVYRLLHGSPTSRKARFGLPFWVRRLAFHCTLVLLLPVLAGLLPFGSFCLVMNDLFQTSVEISASVFSSFTEWSAQLV